MTFELIAAFVSAVAMAGVGMILRALSRGRLPKWLVPAMAGLGMIGFAVWAEYDWFPRQVAALPEGVEVVKQEEEAMPLRPWTYVVPVTMRFMAIDMRRVAQHPDNPALRMAPLYNFARWQAIDNAMMIVDCAGGRQVLIVEGVEITAEGELRGAEWATAPEGDGIQAAACRAG
jgi:hypothetical protein